MSKPRIRFKGFEDEWENVKLGDHLNLRRGLTYCPDDVADNGVRVLRSSNIQEGLLALNDDDVFVRYDAAIKIAPVQNGNILITAANGSKALVGKHCIVPENQEQMVHGGFMLLGETSIPKYLNASMYAPWFKEEVRIHSAGGNGSISNLNKKDVDAFCTEMPTKSAETDIIGEFFYHFDKLYSAVLDKITSLKSLKICYLNRLFPIGGGNEPPVRLAGFSGEWKKVKLSDLLTIREDIAGDNFTKEDVLSVSGEYGVVNQIEFQGRSFAGASISNYRVVNIGNVVYTKSPLKASPYGIIKTAKEHEGIVSPLYAVYTPKEDCDADFLQTYFESRNRLNGYLRPLVNKGAKNTLLISDNGALQGNVTVPSKEEQKAISNFFSKLDKTIRLHEEELERLKALKESCLQGMFV